MADATLTISSKNYSSWSLRGWLLCKMSGIDFAEAPVDPDDADNRQELLLLSPSVRVPRLEHGKIAVWDTLAIAEYLNETFPKAGLFPEDPVHRAHCRAISGEMHSGFHNLRSALPMNLKSRHAAFKVFSGARPDIERVKTIWQECLDTGSGPFLFGERPTVADAMYAPVCTRFRTYSVALDTTLQTYADHVLGWDLMREWTDAALAEPEAIVELEVEF
ncbi:glutathione S-transferase family protein [Sagittula stellata]|uniref:Glutathione S-transferase n=1 Tax=Sagittula stellata (strain ATCC 700073 / DSM 11524 / E-37) TaxID=388399 RepID=A3K298_SAGS3|nr:glutathione S-transferase family protein [Sagittula stellata]EBA09044.1 glutathione S-transferase [Sagittula stellata E-37]